MAARGVVMRSWFSKVSRNRTRNENNRVRLVLEALEDRCVPADVSGTVVSGPGGIVSIARNTDGDITITSDYHDDEITVQVVPGTSDLMVSTTGTAEFRVGNVIVFPETFGTGAAIGIRNINIDMGDGLDKVRL